MKPTIKRPLHDLLKMGAALVFVLGSAGSTTPAQEPNRLIFYLHGRILEEQGLGATSEVFGHYDYEGIVQELGRNGHTVVSEIRDKNTDPSTYAEKVAADIRKRIADGIPPSHITAVGASKGAAITVLVSNLLRNRQIKYVILAICGGQTDDYFEKNGVCVYGEVLSVYETSDEIAGSCKSSAAVRPSSPRTKKSQRPWGMGMEWFTNLTRSGWDLPCDGPRDSRHE